jgi:hypothetical protein
MTNETIWYMAHPVAGAASANAARALRWLAWLRKREPEACIIAPWLAAILAGDDDEDPKQRARGLRESALVASQCDGVVLVGGVVSEGMQGELDACAENGGMVCDLTALGDEPPSDARLEELFDQRVRALGLYAAPATVLELGCTEWEAA